MYIAKVSSLKINQMSPLCFSSVFDKIDFSKKNNWITGSHVMNEISSFIHIYRKLYFIQIDLQIIRTMLHSSMFSLKRSAIMDKM